MKHNEAAELLGAYALDAVEEDESPELETHVAACNECQAELDGYRTVAAVLAGAGELAPGTAWEGIIEKLDPELPSLVSAPREEHSNVIPLRSTARWWVSATAAAAAFAVVLGVAYLAERSTVEGLRGEVTAAQSRAADAESALAGIEAENALARAARDAAESANSLQVSLRADSTAAATTIVLTEDGTGYIADSTLPALPEGRTYQLWAVVDGRVISAGVLGPDPEIVPFHVDPVGLEALAITEEVVGGVAVSENPILVAWSK
jgi:hypothetical protein